MADVIATDCANTQMIKADKNNNTTATAAAVVKIDHETEQSDVVHNGVDAESANVDEQPLSSKTDNTNPLESLSTDTTNIEASPPLTNPYKDFSGVDTESFITTTLQNNPKDRTLLLTLEKLFQQFIQNEEQTSHQFQAMNSYERMIVHRVAAFFGLDHNVDKNGQAIIVTKTANTRVPDFSFQNFIPTDELTNGAVTASSVLPIDSTTRRLTRRNEKNPAQPTFTAPATKPSFERAQYYAETRDKLTNQSSNKTNRKPQRFNINHHTQQTNIQTSSHLINPRAQPLYPSVSNSYYAQPQTTEHEFKQQMTASPMYNYVPMMTPTSFPHGNNIQVPVLLHQQPNGQIQYVFPTHSVQQPTDGQYMPIYRSDAMQPVVENNSYGQHPFLHLYPSHSYPHGQQTAYLQPAPSVMMPPNNPTSIQYATNQLASLNLQSQYDESRFSQATYHSMKRFGHTTSSNGFTRTPNYHQYRPVRPLASTNADKPSTTIENDMKTTINNHSDPKSLSEPAQEKN